MARDRVFGCLIVCLWLAGTALEARGMDAAHFQAVNLTRFPEAVALPDVSARDLAGKTVRLRSLQGRVLLLNFWTTW